MDKYLTTNQTILKTKKCTSYIHQQNEHVTKNK
jgi:hypothetical protein